MDTSKIVNYIKEVLVQMPMDWLKLTTHRLDIYNEALAKTEFLEAFENLYLDNQYATAKLKALPTAFDYIRLGHPLSSILEWCVAQFNQIDAKQVISFDSITPPLLAVLRKNLFENKKTLVCHQRALPKAFNADIFQSIYGYQVDFLTIDSMQDIPTFDGSIVYINQPKDITQFELSNLVDFNINLHPDFGSIIVANGAQNESYINEIQHVRRRETIAMTPANALAVLQTLCEVESTPLATKHTTETHKKAVQDLLQNITDTSTTPLVASSGLSMQYAIMMSLIDDARNNYPNRPIRFIVPPNCYGGTNDQARRVAACIQDVEIVDLPVDGGNDMVQGIETVLTQMAEIDAVPFIIAEIPTNPRVEVPDLQKLASALAKKRVTSNGNAAVESVFILDQTFCPNVHFLGDGAILSSVKAISYASGSKFPSGGLCTAGYCVSNQLSASLMDKIGLHLDICDNEATSLQYEILAQQLPSMLQRIDDAYKNTRAFVAFIQEHLPSVKINFVSEALAQQSFTPSVFSLDLPTKGDTEEAREMHKRMLNLKLIEMMIQEIPNESKFCVSYGQLKGCYWTIPATSTQGTTKEGDKDYIVRVALSANMDLEAHKQVFKRFVESLV